MVCERDREREREMERVRERWRWGRERWSMQDRVGEREIKR